MKVMFVLDGLRAVVDDLRATVESPVVERDGAEVYEREAANDADEQIEAAFVFHGTRAELLGTAKAIDALMAKIRATATPEPRLAYDFETQALMATEWAS